jgi:hypothetical protein
MAKETRRMTIPEIWQEGRLNYPNKITDGLHCPVCKERIEEDFGERFYNWGGFYEWFDDLVAVEMSCPDCGITIREVWSCDHWEVVKE